MLTPELLDVLRQLAADGVELAVNDEGRLTVHPGSKVSPEHSKLLRANTVEIKAALAADTALPEPCTVPPTSEPAAGGTGTPTALAAPAEPTGLARSKWRAAGIYIHGGHGMWSKDRDGIPTHTFGDAHAAKIISGEIPYQDAVRAHRETQHRCALVGANLPPRWNL